jgi:hypothetical protein
MKNVNIGTSGTSRTSGWSNNMSITNISSMFSSCTSLKNITIKYENKYVILGEEYKTDYAFSNDIVIAIATLNVLGKPYWIELKKQNFSFGYDLDKFIEERIIVLDRDRKIDDILI